MWKAIRDAIQSDEATARFVKILIALTIMFAVLAVVMWAVSAPMAESAFRVIIGLLSAGQPFAYFIRGAEAEHDGARRTRRTRRRCLVRARDAGG